MKAVIQRVINSSVAVDGEIIGEIGKGFMILLGVMQNDTKEDADKLIKKIPVLRIFEDENEKMNLSCLDTGGEILVISQFTLCADCSHGRRPSFTNSAPPQEANSLYCYFVLYAESECHKALVLLYMYYLELLLVYHFLCLVL